jgi:hypothetical protein
MATATQHVCDQCGRVGARGFRVVPPSIDERYGEIPGFTECANKDACRKRWPRRESVDA